MRQFEGTITVKIASTVEDAIGAALDTEVYLNGNVASEIFKRFGVSIRVHLKGPPKEISSTS